ncbi:MAG: ATP-binding protein [Dermatophilaceae bacterium]
MSAQTLRVPWEMSSAVQVRRTLVSELRALEVDETVVDEAEIVVSELVTNAIRHAKPLPDGTIRVSWTVSDGVVEVAVTDGGGPTTPRPVQRRPWSINGRGLRIVRSLAHAWGVKDEDGSCTVWVSLGGPSPGGFP